jgi:hypothetical protein
LFVVDVTSYPGFCSILRFEAWIAWVSAGKKILSSAEKKVFSAEKKVLSPAGKKRILESEFNFSEPYHGRLGSGWLALTGRWSDEAERAGVTDRIWLKKSWRG